MTAQERVVWKTEALIALKAFLEVQIGFPNCSNNEVMEQLKPMWDHLTTMGLVKPGMTLEWFLKEAQAAYMKAEINRITGFWPT